MVGARELLERRSKYIAIILFSALVVGYESVAVELALNTLSLDIFLIGSMPAIIAGFIMIVMYPRPTVKVVKALNRREWVFLTLLSVFAAVGVILWYDAVGQIGAGKEAILGGGSSEVLFVMILSAIFLGERLKRWEVFGSALIIIGVLLVLIEKESFTLSLGQGEMEAIVSSFFLGTSAVMIARMLRDYDVLPVSAIELVFSGILLLAIGVAMYPIVWPDAAGWLVMVALGIFPALCITTYYAGLKGIGASITSVLFSLSGILTVVAQISILLFMPLDIQLPKNLILALIGGAIAVVGVYILNMRPGAKKKLPGALPPA
jgi:drug/metabolite transporter (DMT)-like permease